MTTLSAPFPYHGGKRRYADLVWAHFGQPDIYVEPFFGTGAILLGNPNPCRREVVCDVNGFICNVYRAIREAPKRVAEYADWPTFHDDLTARHQWLVGWGRKHGPKLQADPEWFDAKAAGWWIWGKSQWIGPDWCEGKASNKIPAIDDKGPNGQGVQAQRNRIPLIQPQIAGRGTQKQRTDLDAEDPNRLLPWFEALSKRLQNVIVLNRDWTAPLSDTILCKTEGSPKDLSTAVFLDPPYVSSRGTYGEQGNPAADSYAWAVEHGDQYRIAYCAGKGDFECPDGWLAHTEKLASRRHDSKQAVHHEQVFFSPACEGQQTSLF